MYALKILNLILHTDVYVYTLNYIACTCILSANFSGF